MKAIITLILLSTILIAQERTYQREHTYLASEYDSKVISRQKALDAVRIDLVKELGVYIEGSTESRKSEHNGVLDDYFKQEVKTISAGVTKTKILSESWDGVKYWLRVEIKIDPNEVSRKINYALIRKGNEIVNKLNTRVNELETKIGKMSTYRPKKSAVEIARERIKVANMYSDDIWKAIQAAND